VYDRDSDSNGVLDDPGGTSLELLLVSTDGGEPYVRPRAISGDGRYVLYNARNQTPAPNEPTCGDEVSPVDCVDVFVFDRETSMTSLVSASQSGDPGDRSSGAASMTRDGRFVVFYSDADNLVPEDGNRTMDVFLRDMDLGTVEWVSVAMDGGKGNGDSCTYTSMFLEPCTSISGDGRLVAFASVASNLVPGDTNCASDVFLRDRQAGVTVRLSMNTKGEQLNSSSSHPLLSADGSFAIYSSGATDLVPPAIGGLFVQSIQPQPASAEAGKQQRHFSTHSWCDSPLGDVDCDQILTASDSLRVLSVLAGLGEAPDCILLGNVERF
jgi:hypothetical protein